VSGNKKAKLKSIFKKIRFYRKLPVMKRLLQLLFFTVLMQQLSAQTITGRLEGLRDAWGTSFDYIGDIKNGQPNGLGIAIYSNNNALRYSGYFVNGQYSGKGVLLFKDSTFLSGEWKNGKLNGKGASLNSGGDFYAGYFANGVKEGSGAFVFADNGLLVGNMKNDTYAGRCIFIPASGKTVSDNIYSDGKKNGTGYQYELDSKTLYEGAWSNGDWVNSGTAAYTSFLKGSNFYAEGTDDQILMGGIDKTNDNVLQDTAFFYSLKTQKRYFGLYDKGNLTDGVIVKDSTRFLGKVNDGGAYGPCSFYKVSKYYDEGNYQADYLSGSNCLSIDLAKMTTYYGFVGDNGAFTGKAWFSNKYNELYVGSFEDGSFTGTGYIVFKNGKTLKGTFNSGLVKTLTSLTDENGAPVSLKPKTFSEALSIVANEYTNDYDAFKGDNADEDEYSDDDYYDSYKSLVSFPNTVEADAILEDYDFYLMYNATLYKGTNYQEAVAKYNELCKTLAATSLHLKYSKTPVTLSGDIESPKESETTRTKFTLNNYSSLSDYNVYAELRYLDGDYKVNLVAGDVVFDD
jgi:hypothetical protein